MKINRVAFYSANLAIKSEEDSTFIAFEVTVKVSYVGIKIVLVMDNKPWIKFTKQKIRYSHKKPVFIMSIIYYVLWRGL